MVIVLEITTQKRERGDTVRPAVSIPDDIWRDFKFTYADKKIRDSVVSKLLQKQLENEVVLVRFNII